jgi:putative intracellular protease/amidase
MVTKKVLFIIAAHGFQPVEYQTPKNIIEAAGYTVVTASDLAGDASTQDNSVSAKVDYTLNQVKGADYDGVFVIGGPGALEHLDNENTYHVVQQAYNAGKIVGAICVSPRILAKAQLLHNKKATGWDEDNLLAGIFKDHGAIYVHEPVVHDDRIITASGPRAVQEWGHEIVQSLHTLK